MVDPDFPGESPLPPKPALSKPSTHAKDFGFLPIPQRCQYDPERPFEFTTSLNVIFGLTATFTVSNLYYIQPCLNIAAEQFHVTKAEATRAFTLVQLGYLTSLLLVAPLSDLIRQRGFILALVFGGAILSIGLAVTRSFAVFQAISYFVGICTVLPQVLNPMAADKAPPHKRAAAVSIVVCGLISGMLFARITSGLMARFTSSFQNIYYMAVALQLLEFAALWWMLPDWPRKQTDQGYFRILASMAHFMVTEPKLIQAMLIGCSSCAIFVSWWTNLTFLLADAPFGYDAFQIGLFALTGLVSICLAPQLGRWVDRLNPWTGTLFGLLIHLVCQSIALACAKYSLGPVIIVCIFVDVAQQLQQIGNQMRVYTINPLARGRLNGCYGASVFAGQLMGSGAGTKVYLSYGWRPAYGMGLAWAFAAIFFLFLRGPWATGWIGWSGIYSTRKAKPNRVLASEEGGTEQGQETKEGSLEKEAVQSIPEETDARKR